MQYIQLYCIIKSILTLFFTLYYFFQIINIKVYFDQNYYYDSSVDSTISLYDFRKFLEQEYMLLFQDRIDIVGIQNSNHYDIPINEQLVKTFIKDGDKIYPLRSMLSISNNQLLVQILKIPKQQYNEQQQKKSLDESRCQPYCQPLADYRVYDEVCPECGEIKAFAPNITDKYCTRFCYSSDIRKQKVSGQSFCSICISRYRNKKYQLDGCMHQCIMCHRPWLILNRQGLCRTCFATQHTEYYFDKAVFKADRIKVVGQDAIDINTDEEIQQDQIIVQIILSKHPENERIVDKVTYGKKDD